MSKQIDQLTSFIRQLGRDPEEAYSDGYGASNSRARNSHIAGHSLAFKPFTDDEGRDYRPEIDFGARGSSHFDVGGLSHFDDNSDFIDSIDFS